MKEFQIIAKDPITGFEYFQRSSDGTVFFYGGFAGKKSGMFGPKAYWDYMLTMPNHTKQYGPFLFLDQCTPRVIQEINE